MKVGSSLVVGAAAIWGGYHLISQHHAARVLGEVLASSDVNGFIEVPAPVNQDPNTIYVVAAQNCPHEAAQKADQLATKLGAQGILVVRTSQVNYHMTQADQSVMNRLTAVMNGPLPLVFVHGRAAMNPEMSQVVEEYNNPGRIRAPQ